MGLKNLHRKVAAHVENGLEDAFDRMAEAHPIRGLKRLAYRHEHHPILAFKRFFHFIGSRVSPTPEQLIASVCDEMLGRAVRVNRHIAEWRFPGLVTVTVSPEAWKAYYGISPKAVARDLEDGVRARLQEKYHVGDIALSVRVRSDEEVGYVLRDGDFLVEAVPYGGDEAAEPAPEHPCDDAAARGAGERTCGDGSGEASAKTSSPLPAETLTPTDAPYATVMPGRASEEDSVPAEAWILYRGVRYRVLDGTTIGVNRRFDEHADIELPYSRDLKSASHISGRFTHGAAGWAYTQVGRYGCSFVRGGAAERVELAEGDAEPLGEGDAIYFPCAKEGVFFSLEDEALRSEGEGVAATGPCGTLLWPMAS